MDPWQKMQLADEEVMLVDANDQVLSVLGKVEAHRFPGHLHRAVTVFLFNAKMEVLLTQRSSAKPLWPLFWDAACSTHQWPGENDEVAARRRLPFEIGISVDALENAFAYEYHAVYNQDWAENEVNHILVGRTNLDPVPNPEEVADWRWASQEQVERELSTEDHRFAPWFSLAWERLGVK